MKNKKRISKFLSLVLRHSPETINLNMDENGWVEIEQLINNGKKYKNINLNKDLIEDIVKNNDKQRFTLDDSKKRIRANQGHSINVDLELESKIPPNILYHGTTERFLDSILKDGLKPMSRQHVHLSSTKDTAINVGKRHGKPVVLIIDSEKMDEEGYEFFLSKNDVWLVRYVPSKFIKYFKK